MQNAKFKIQRWMWVVGVIVLLLVSWFGYRWWNRDVVMVKTATVAKGVIEEVISSSGVVDAPVYELGTKLGGKIGVWKVREGDRVRAGQLLAELDSYEQAANDFQRTAKLYEQGVMSKQSYDAAKTMFESSRIISPNAGIVAKIEFDEGETVVPGQMAVTVVNYDKSWIEAQIDEIDIANVKVGDRVKITSDVYPDKVFDGELYWIAPLAELRKVGGRVKMDEESYVFPCKVKFLGNHEDLKVNMSVNVDIATKKNPDALIVPREALISKDDKAYVFVINKFNRAKETKIEIGIRTVSSIEALSGVAAGDQVAVSNVSKLKNRGRVKIER
ncbi:MAG: efflux RND transporter periplasmic adaptor subunit [Candidatus Margulisbacteria bacterium]|nr:efflux RND transporter periplasmic adaptor subunit [Candidatus Margulisiibacteriota bacterium]